MIARTLTLLVAMLSCGCGNAEGAAPSPTSTAAVPSTTSASAAAEPGATASPASPAIQTSIEGDETACVRALLCCRAFVEAIGDEAEANRARTACESLSRVEALGDAANDACANATDGWRQSLVNAEREVPTACAALRE